MTPLEELFLEIERHPVLRAHSGLVFSARKEYDNLKKKLAMAIYMASNDETPHGESWVETIASMEIACRPFKPGS